MDGAVRAMVDSGKRGERRYLHKMAAPRKDNMAAIAGSKMFRRLTNGKMFSKQALGTCKGC